MIIVTGAAGFIGSNIIKGLNSAGYTNILAVDDLTDGHKFVNLAAGKVADYQDYEDFIAKIQAGPASFAEPITCIFHHGACSVTTEWNGRYMMRNNYDYSKYLLHYCLAAKIPFIYASSAAVYGNSTVFDEQATEQLPINVYGYSKWQFDRYMLQHLPTAQSQVVGLRYFNVYGPQEQHKGTMASVAFHFMNQLRENNEVKLFAGDDSYGDGEQLRDFVFVDDVVKVNLWFLQNPQQSGIFNVGTGQARTFNALARALIGLYGQGQIRYVPFPAHLKGAYQNYTQADISKLRRAGYQQPFTSLEEGLKRYFHTTLKPKAAALV